ncbi:ABC transporter G member 14 [Castilleja foliolosa]|uniref:ABC transporter G member 14 n=1 Tax=Castilleja foliolosa TaxID=1961234 RepID=A0ABD3BQZ9_9LAMI
MSLSLAAPLPENDNQTDEQQCHIHLSMLMKSHSYLQRLSYPITLKFEEIVYELNHQNKQPSTTTTQKTILKGITGFVRPGELLAMLGPSGGGKTTLLTALGGRHLTGILSGNITYNNRPFSSNIKRQTGFVTQDDVLYAHLTVFETLLFTALLRLPQTLTKDEKAHHVDEVVSELGLTRCSNNMIGGPFVRGISGGERKRVSIGQEMLINPSLLLLDEPTSGLDSTGAHRIVNILKGLARGGRTVVTTIHQPSSRIYYMFDKVVVLAQGSPIYYGPGSGAVDYFASIGFATNLTVNPADLLLDLANGIGPDFEHATDESANTQQDPDAVREFLVSAYEINIAERLKTELCISDGNNDNSNEETPKNNAKSGKWCTSWWHQFKILLLRGLRERRFEALNKLRIFQVISVAILGGLLWWRTPPSRIDDHVAMLFFFSVFWGFYPLYYAVFTFPQERRMLIKERSSGMYRLSAYFLARTVSDLPMDLALPTAFTCIFYWMGGLKPDLSAFIFSLFVVLFGVLVAQSLGLAFGALLMDVKQAATLASVTTIVFSMAGGYYVKQIPIFVVWLKYLSFSYYFYKLLLGIQYDENEYYECGAKVYCRVSDHPAIKSIGLNYLWIDISAMAVMLVVYRLVAYLALHRVK